jgi:hypothetical protein
MQLDANVDLNERPPHELEILVCQRWFGPFRYHFIFLEVNVEKFNSKLEADLLSIRTPKGVLSAVKPGRWMCNNIDRGGENSQARDSRDY